MADPADDFAALVADAPPEAVETVLEAYSHTRVERPDPNLLVRARLVAELGLLSTMMVALARKDVGAVEVLTTQLRRLDDAVHTSEEPDDYRRTSLAPVGPAPPHHAAPGPGRRRRRRGPAGGRPTRSRPTPRHAPDADRAADTSDATDTRMRRMPTTRRTRRHRR